MVFAMPAHVTVMCMMGVISVVLAMCTVGFRNVQHVGHANRSRDGHAQRHRHQQAEHQEGMMFGPRHGCCAP